MTAIKNRNLLDYFILFFKGMLMGAANKIPGVSGGVISLILGMYEEMIAAVGKIDVIAFRLLLNGKWKAFAHRTHFYFLISVFAGSVSTFFTVSYLLNFLLSHYELQVWSYFFGLILASVFFVSYQISSWNLSQFLLLIVATLLGLFLSFSSPLSPNPNLFFVFLCGIFSMAGITIPGFSSSFVLILMGNYVLILVHSVSSLFQVLGMCLLGDFSFLHDSNTIQLLWVVLVFGLGTLVGLLSLSKIIGKLLHLFHNQVLSVLMGFIAGTLYIAWPWRNKQHNPTTANAMEYYPYLPSIHKEEFFWGMVFILIGMSTVFLLLYFTTKSQDKTRK